MWTVGRIHSDSFRHNECQKAWRQAVDTAGGIYFHRWGDAALRRVSADLCNMSRLPLPSSYVESYSSTINHGCVLLPARWQARSCAASQGRVPRLHGADHWSICTLTREPGHVVVEVALST